jgi:hypothetical protein
VHDRVAQLTDLEQEVGVPSQPAFAPGGDLDPGREPVPLRVAVPFEEFTQRAVDAVVRRGEAIDAFRAQTS